MVNEVIGPWETEEDETPPDVQSPDIQAPSIDDAITDYFTYLTGFIPTPDQAGMLKSIIHYDRVEASAGRQSGKTLTASVATMYLAYEFDVPLRILMISPQDNQVYAYMRGFFRGEHREEFTKDLVGSKSVQNIVPLTGFQLGDGTQVKVCGVTERDIRGFPADVVIIDEAALVSNQSILTAMGNLSGEASKLILLSTPVHNPLINTPGEPKFMKWLRDPDYKVFHWSSADLPWHNKRLLDIKRKEFTPAHWASEVLGREPTDDEVSNSGDVIGEVIFTTVPVTRRR